MRLYSNRKAWLETMPQLLVRATAARRPIGRPVSIQTQVRLNPDQAKELATAYRAGRTIKELAQRFGVHRTTVSTLLRRFGVEQRPRGLSVDRPRGDHHRDAEAAAGEAGGDALVDAVAGSAAGYLRCHGGQGVAGLPGAAVAGRVVPVLHRPGAGRQGHRRRRVVCEPAGERGRSLRSTRRARSRRLDRTAPILPLQPGLAERRSHDYLRHGTSTLFAALEIATGTVTGAVKPRHRHQEFLAFLKQVTRAYPDHVHRPASCTW